MSEKTRRKINFKRWFMRLSIVMFFLCSGIMLGSLGCSTTPVDVKIQKAIHLLDESVKDYTGFTQTVLNAKMLILKELYEQEKDPVRKKQLEKKLRTYLSYYKQGKWLPITTRELYEWSVDRPLPDKEEK